MKDSDLVHEIVCFDIELEQEFPEVPLGNPAATSAPSVVVKQEKLTEQEAGMEGEKTKEEEFKVNIKQEVLDKPEDREGVENTGSGGSLSRRQHRRQQRGNGARRSTRKNAEEKKDGKDIPKRKADNETGEGGSGKAVKKSEEGKSGEGTSGDGTSGEGTRGESTSGDGPSGEKKAKAEEFSALEGNAENDNTKTPL